MRDECVSEWEEVSKWVIILFEKKKTNDCFLTFLFIKRIVMGSIDENWYRYSIDTFAKVSILRYPSENPHHELHIHTVMIWNSNWIYSHWHNTMTIYWDKVSAYWEKIANKVWMFEILLLHTGMGNDIHLSPTLPKNAIYRNKLEIKVVQN